MEFDVSKVYTIFNLDDIKKGSKVYGCDYKNGLINKVESEDEEPCLLIGIDKEADSYPFTVEGINGAHIPYQFVYLVSEPEEKVLKWTDLKFGDIIRNKLSGLEFMVIGMSKDDSEGEMSHICIQDCWIADESLERHWEKVENED